MLKLEIVTPEKKVVDIDVDAVSVPTATGEIGVLPQHAPLISALKPGILSYTQKGASSQLAITGGFVEVNSDRVAVMTDSAESAEEIDAVTAKAARDEAQRALTAMGSASLEETEAAREHAEAAAVRFQLASGK